MDEDTDVADIAAEHGRPVRGPAGRGSLHRAVGRQSSAVNLNLLARDAELKRLMEEVCLPQNLLTASTIQTVHTH